MSRFVAVSFLFMGWAFYELSGGADFKPQERSGTQTAAVKPAPDARVTAASLVTRPVIRPKGAAEAEMPPERIAEAGLVQPQLDADTSPAADLAQLAALGASLAPGGLISGADPAGSVQVASLEGGLAGLNLDSSLTLEAAPETLAALVETEDTGPDLRQVTASAANMRGGPGTSYPVIGRMTRGQEVEVLSDTGTGWLRLRDAQKNKVGWIAASLISRKAP